MKHEWSIQQETGTSKIEQAERVHKNQLATAFGKTIEKTDRQMNWKEKWVDEEGQLEEVVRRNNKKEWTDTKKKAWKTDGHVNRERDLLYMCKTKESWSLKKYIGKTEAQMNTKR
jgi:hypothetical protein